MFKSHRPLITLLAVIMLVGLSAPALLSAAPNRAILHEGTLSAGQIGWRHHPDGTVTPFLADAGDLAETGKPVLAVEQVRLLVPFDSPVLGIEIVPVAISRIATPGLLRQGDLIYDDKSVGVTVDRLEIGAEAYPVVWGEYGGDQIWRGYRWVTALVYPLRAVKDEAGQWSALELLERYEVRLLTGPGGSTPEIAQRERLVAGERERCEKILRRLCANSEVLGGYARQDGVAVAEPAGGFQPSKTPSLSGSSVRYLIITGAALETAFQVLADHKTAQGLPAVVKTVDWIEANYRHGADVQETIRNFIREAYTRWGVEFVLMGGDTDVLPPRFVISTYHPPQGETAIPSDLYFACLDGNWDDDGDAIFGEPFTSTFNPGDECDLANEVEIGRATVSSPADVAVFVDKIIDYTEKAAGTAYTNRALFAAEVLFPQDYTPGDDILIDGAQFADSLHAKLTNCTGMTDARLYEATALWPGSVPLTRAAVIDSLNGGHYGIINQIGHGFYFNMSVGDANFMVSDADALVNGDHTFLLYSLNCASAAFDVACLMERFMQNPNGGSVASIGSSRSAFPINSNNYQQEFFRHLFCLDEMRIGPLITLSRLPYLGITYYNTVDRWTNFNYTLLGDPSLAIWAASPALANVTKPGSLTAGEQAVAVHVASGGQPVEGALVCLAKDGEDYVYDVTNASGDVSLPFIPVSAGNAVLTVTGKNLAYTQSTIPVSIGGSGAYIAFDQMTITDDGTGGSAGNGNGQPEAGETLALLVTCRDTGSGGATGCNASLGTAAGGISILDGAAVIGTVPSGGTKLAEDVFLVQLDAAVTDGTHAPFTLTVTDGGGKTSYQSTWTLTVLAPEVEPVELKWSDWPYGNGDGTQQDNERITIEAKLKNYGVGLADLITGKLRTLDPTVTLYDTTVTYTGIDLLQTSAGSGKFSFAEASIATDSWCWIYFEDNHGRSWRHDFHVQSPGIPTGLATDTSQGADVIALSWTPLTSEGLRGYNVYRSDFPAGPFSRVNLDLVDGISYYRDGGLDLLTRYYYRVTAVDSSLIEGGPSLTISESTAPPEAYGFPLPFALESNGHCAVGDVNGDGVRDIVLGSDEIYVWDAFGGELFDGDNNAQTHGPITGLGSDFQPGGIALAQLDGVHGEEIIVGERQWDVGVQNAVHIFRWNGTEMTGWPKLLRTAANGWNWTTPAIGDVDGDGDPEIVVNTLDGRTWVWHVDGSELMDGDLDPTTDGVFIVRAGWNQEWGVSSPALFDLDGDGAKEIIFGSKYGGAATNYMYAYRYDQTQAAGWPYATGSGNILCSPTVADLNGDGVWEVIFISQNNRLNVVQQNGTSYSGFPIVMISNTTDPIPSPAVGNFDLDDDLEIVVISTIDADNAQLYVIDTAVGSKSGEVLPGWPVAIPGSSDCSPVVGDIDGDGSLDILHGIGGRSTESPNKLYAFKSNGSLVDGFPIALAGALRSSPVICDLDKDNDVDIVAGGWDNLMHVWDMPFAYDSAKLPWRTFRCHNLRDGVYRPDSLVVNVPDVEALPERMNVSLYPNPFNPSTTVKLFLPGEAGAAQQLDVGIYNLQGRLVRHLHAGPAIMGWHSWVWDGRSDEGRTQASGLYFLRARSRDETIVVKMSLIK
jgi:hypothetical protein